MGKWKKRLLAMGAMWLFIGLPGYYVLVMHSPKPEAPPFVIDGARLRHLANSLPGERPSEVRYEHVFDFEFAQAMVMAGERWEGTQVAVYSYQLLTPTGTIVVDTAMNRAMAKPEFMVPFYDDAAYARMQNALDGAGMILVTHEHMDHIGGLAASPNLAALLPALRLTQEQLANPKGMEPAELPAALMQGYQPLQYDDMLAVAPGVVLVKAPGHTPGSQMVYVQLADGRELLLLGDVAWQHRNIEKVRERPLFMTLMIGEDRAPVLRQFQALHDLEQTEPAVRLVPGHDAEVVKRLTSEGLLKAGFRE